MLNLWMKAMQKSWKSISNNSLFNFCEFEGQLRKGQSYFEAANVLVPGNPGEPLAYASFQHSLIDIC